MPGFVTPTAGSFPLFFVTCIRYSSAIVASILLMSCGGGGGDTSADEEGVGGGKTDVATSKVPTLTTVSSSTVVAGSAVTVTGEFLNTVKRFSVNDVELIASDVTSTSAT